MARRSECLPLEAGDADHVLPRRVLRTGQDLPQSGCSVCREAVSLVEGLATSCPWLRLCLWSISLVTDSSVCEKVTDSVPEINSCEGEGGKAGQREELVPLTPGSLVQCSGQPLVWAASGPAQPWPSWFLDSFD